MPARARSRCVNVKGRASAGKASWRRVDRSSSPNSYGEPHSKYCECEECYSLYDEESTLCNMASWLNFRNLTAAGSIVFFLVLIRFLALLFPFGVFRSTADRFDMSNIGSRAFFTLQQHIWSLIPFAFGGKTRTVIDTFHLLLNTIILCSMEVYMSYMAAIIISSSIFTVLGQYAEAYHWKVVFKVPRRFVNIAMTLLCVVYAMEARAPTGLKY